MSPSDVVIPPPTGLKHFDYPVAVALLFLCLFTTILVFVASRFDPTQGLLTISIMVVVAFCAALGFSMLFTVPNDETTSLVVGGLVASFSAVITYWLTKRNGGNH